MPDETKDPKDKSQKDPQDKPFLPETLDRTVIAIPLLTEMKEKPNDLLMVIIDLNLEFPGGRDAARAWVEKTIKGLVEQDVKPDGWSDQKVSKDKTDLSPQYVFAELRAPTIRDLVNMDAGEHDPDGTQFRKRAIFHIWPDFPITAHTNKSISTVKADAARAAFAALGEDIVWAVMDSGIDKNHSHFRQHKNLELDAPLKHYDFTGEGIEEQDPNGHGTHVAGIIAGERDLETGEVKRAIVRSRSEDDKPVYQTIDLGRISGMAPKCKLVSLRVLDASGKGATSNLMAAIGKIQEINGHGRRLLIHGVNISIGNEFKPEWFACGQSPLCTEVNRLVSSGVVVVVSSGNSGYGKLQSSFTGVVSAGMALTINDPGNADQAITVGATHRDMPHVYGVSYFSSKGPTGDGRAKPDLIAPGEKIVSCAAGNTKQKAVTAAAGAMVAECDYVEDSGTSMAAPHVSGVIAAFLSIRREFIGQPQKVKEIFLSTATDLKREKYFQGYGLVDLMRAIQSV